MNTKITSLVALVLFFATILMSCDNDLSPDIETIEAETLQEPQKEVPSVTLTQDEMILLEELSNKTPKRSVEQAVEIANDFFGKGTDSNSLSKRGTSMPKCEVLTKTRQSISKSGNATEDADTLLYVLNYDNGYAVISADLRVPDKIIAYSEEGNFDLNTDNPGIQIFIDMAQDYIDFSIEKAESMRDSLEKALDEKISSAIDCQQDSKSNLSKTKIITSKTLVYENVPYTYEKTEILGPYIKTYWNQDWPYNKYTLNDDSVRCPAGCVAVAFSQLMAYWRWPFAYNKNESSIIQWNLMLQWPPNKDYIAQFIHEIGVSINTKYDTSGSSASTEYALRMLRNYKYKADEIQSYSFDAIKQSIDNKRPVIIEGFRQDDTENKKIGHCWLIDGYAKETWSYNGEKRFVIMYKDDVTGEISGELLVQPEIGVSTAYYQHFNLGWKYQSSTRGYYSQKVFDVTQEYILDSFDGNRLVRRPYYGYGKKDYWYKVRIATNIYY